MCIADAQYSAEQCFVAFRGIAQFVPVCQFATTDDVIYCRAAVANKFCEMPMFHASVQLLVIAMIVQLTIIMPL